MALSNPALVLGSVLLYQLGKQIKQYDTVQTTGISIKSLSKSVTHIEDTLDTLYGNNLFTILDLLKGYHQIEVVEKSHEKTTFTTHIGSSNIFVYFWTDQCFCIVSMFTGTNPPQRHWQVCTVVHRRHIHVQQHL